MESVSPFHENAALWTLLFALGAALGSFAGVCASRIPAGMSVVFPPSRCDSCETPLRALHNVPVISWLFLGGRCAYCESRIPAEHPLVEIFCGALALALYAKFGLSVEFVFYLAFSLSLVVATLTDARHLVIPDAVTIPGTAAGLVLGALRTDWRALEAAVFSPGAESFLLSAADAAILDSLAGALLGGGIFFLLARAYRGIRKREGLGMGDVKLVSMLGAFLGAEGAVVVMFLSSLLGTVAGLAIIVLGGKTVRHAIPYGPFLSVSALAYLLWGGFPLFSALGRWSF